MISPLVLLSVSIVVLPYFKGRIEVRKEGTRGKVEKIFSFSKETK